jgi:hypothetical protein
LFDRNERMVYDNINTNGLNSKISEYWTQNGFYITQSTPTFVSGEGPEEWGLKPMFSAYVNTQGSKSYIDLVLSGTLTQNGIILLVILSVLIWPLAIILGFLSYTKLEDKSKSFSYYFWDSLNKYTGKTGAPSMPAVGFAPPPPPPPPPPPAPPPQ